MLAETFVDLLTDKNHWMFEGVVNLVENVIIGALLFPFVKRWIKRHDWKHHGHKCEENQVEGK